MEVMACIYFICILIFINLLLRFAISAHISKFLFSCVFRVLYCLEFWSRKSYLGSFYKSCAYPVYACSQWKVGKIFYELIGVT